MNYPTQTDNPTKAKTYNGWTNYETWNVALWIDNEYFNYSLAMLPSVKTYQDFVNRIKSSYYSNLDAKYNYRRETGDGISWTNPNLNIQELDEKIKELKS
jgi:hypothetical protein